MRYHVRSRVYASAALAEDNAPYRARALKNRHRASFGHEPLNLLFSFDATSILLRYDFVVNEAVTRLLRR